MSYPYLVRVFFLSPRFTWRLLMGVERPTCMLFSGNNLSLSSNIKSSFTPVFFRSAFKVKLGVLYEVIRLKQKAFYMYICIFGRDLLSILNQFLSTTLLILLSLLF